MKIAKKYLKLPIFEVQGHSVITWRLPWSISSHFGAIHS